MGSRKKVKPNKMIQVGSIVQRHWNNWKGVVRVLGINYQETPCYIRRDGRVYEGAKVYNMKTYRYYGTPNGREDEQPTFELYYMAKRDYVLVEYTHDSKGNPLRKSVWALSRDTNLKLVRTTQC